jgi:diaminopimelate decarboxylase/aspartate kinase
MSASAATEWIVLKFGGTSVSTLANWRNIASVVRARRAAGTRVLIVHSALSGVTDSLEKLITAALIGTHAPLLAALEERHRSLADELEVGSSAYFEQRLARLRSLLDAAARQGALSDRDRARIMACGELLATELGARFLNAQGIACSWWDARTGLKSVPRANAPASANYLSATCDSSADAGLRTRLEALEPVVLTQGFIASNAGWRHRAARPRRLGYLGRLLRGQAARGALEIWTDVPGMFSANPRSTPAARLLRALHYDEAQEIASSGAKVLHPRCILPVQGGSRFRCGSTPRRTRNSRARTSAPAAATAPRRSRRCASRRASRWCRSTVRACGTKSAFLADAFQVFKQHGMSVDLVSTSETNVTVSLDPSANNLDAGRARCAGRRSRTSCAACR